MSLFQSVTIVLLCKSLKENCRGAEYLQYENIKSSNLEFSCPTPEKTIHPFSTLLNQLEVARRALIQILEMSIPNFGRQLSLVPRYKSVTSNACDNQPPSPLCDFIYHKKMKSFHFLIGSICHPQRLQHSAVLHALCLLKI